MLNKMLYQVTAQCSSRISFLFHFISSHSILFFFFFTILLFRLGVFLVVFVCSPSKRTFIHICDLLLYFIYFRFTCSLDEIVVACASAWSCSCPCSLVFIISFVCAPLNSVCLCVSFYRFALDCVSGPNFRYNPGSLTYPIRFVMYSCLPFG